MVESNMYLWADPVLKTVASAARKAAKAHHGYVDYEDMQSEGYVYVGTHREEVERLTTGERVNLQLLYTSVYRHMHKYAMKQRYLKDGTTPGDYFLYSPAVISELLPEALDGVDAADSSPSDINGQIRANKPVNERGDRAAMVADIQQAYKALDEDDQALLSHKYRDGGVTDEVVALVYGKPQQTINYRLQRSLRRMAESLGGEPFEGRHAISNARAQQETRQQEWQ